MISEQKISRLQHFYAENVKWKEFHENQFRAKNVLTTVFCCWKSKRKINSELKMSWQQYFVAEKVK